MSRWLGSWRPHREDAPSRWGLVAWRGERVARARSDGRVPRPAQRCVWFAIVGPLLASASPGADPRGCPVGSPETAPSAAAPLAPKPQAGAAEVRWKGQRLVGEKIAPAVGEAAAALVAAWSPWAEAQDYVLELDADLTSLFAHAQKRSGSAEAATIARVLSLENKLAPRPAGRVAHVLAIVELERQEDLGPLLDDLARRHPALASWAGGAKQGTGFVLEDPPVAACLAAAAGKGANLEEWKAKNELANRAAQLVIFERFGRLPHWLVQGLAWHAEENVCGSIWCFPYRSGFVSKKEHRSFDDQLATILAGGRQLAIDDLAGWKRGTYDETRAPIAFGTARFLAKQRTAALPQILEDLRKLREEGAKVTRPDGSWTLNPDYEVPAARQLEVLEARAGKDFLAALRRSCAGN